MKKLDTAGSGRGTSGPRPLVLYVEDEDQNWEVTELRLGTRYTLMRAKNSTEALELLGKAPGLHAILMDIQLHGSELDGIQLTRLLRGQIPEAKWPGGKPPPKVSAPIIFVTAYGSRYSPEELQAAGGDLVITKPVDFLKLTLALANVSASKVSSLLNKG